MARPTDSRVIHFIRRKVYAFRHWLMRTQNVCDYRGCAAATWWIDTRHACGPRKGCAEHFWPLNPPTPGRVNLIQGDGFMQGTVGQWPGSVVRHYRVDAPWANPEEGDDE